MTFKNHITVLLLWLGLLLTPLISAQEDAPETEQDEINTNSGSQETEYSDDNYRRFMELKDQPGPTSTLPTNAYQSGTEKLDELPEDSQKHLRNQLREIILESDEWAPGDENGEYPFAASEAGEKNPALKQQEAEAWGELVGKYHEREAEIYANATRSNAASGMEGGAPDAAQSQAQAGKSGGNKGQESGEAGNETEAEQAGQQGESANNQTASNANEGSAPPPSSPASSSSTSAGDPNAISTTGVSQSALEYLLGNSSKMTNGNESNGQTGAAGSSAAQQQQAANSDPGQTGSPAQQTATQQSVAQQPSSQQEMPQQNTAAAESAQAESASPSQQQNSQQQRQEQQATQENSSEFVVISKGTLSIKELQNAQGITLSTGGNSSQAPPVVIEKDHLRKDDDG